MHVWIEVYPRLDWTRYDMGRDASGVLEQSSHSSACGKPLAQSRAVIGASPKPDRTCMFVRSKPSWSQIAVDGVRRCEGIDEAFVEAWPSTVSGWKTAGMSLAK